MNTTPQAPTAPAEVIVIMEDWHAERNGFFRAYTAPHPDADIVCPLIGYCSPGGSHRTITAAAAEARRRQPGTPIYRAYHGAKPSRLLKTAAERERERIQQSQHELAMARIAWLDAEIAKGRQ